MKTLHLQTPTLSEFSGLIESRLIHSMHIFRGQANEKWGLVPSLYRINIDEAVPFSEYTLGQRYDHWEELQIKYLFNQGHLYVPNMQRGYINDRILAQHFGVPTRLLDWSGSPLVALYFAVQNFQEKENTDAAVFMVLPDTMGLPQDIVKKTVDHSNEPLAQVIAFRPPIFDYRIAAQDSIFTLHPSDDEKEFVPLNERPDVGYKSPYSEERGFVKIIIPAHFKAELHKILGRYGYNRQKLFPGLDSIGATLAASVRIEEFIR